MAHRITIDPDLIESLEKHFGGATSLALEIGVSPDDVEALKAGGAVTPLLSLRIASITDEVKTGGLRVA